MEDLVRVARDRDEAKARDSYTSTSEYWNNSNAEYPDVYTSRRVYIHRDIRTIARNKTFFAMLAAPSFFFLLEQPQRRQDALKKVEATARNSSPFVGYQTGAKPMSPVSFGAEIPRDPRLFLFFSFRFLFFFSRQPFRSKGAISIHPGTRITRVGWREGRKKRGEGTRSSRS